MVPETVLSGARTVSGIAQHFQELKAQATQLTGRGSASARGYFTPSEEEEARHLLVSYWKSRAALMELVLSLRNDPALYPCDFLVGFTGALVLVDAARFLRDSFESNRVVRHKLNEPDPVFNIPAGAYDSVQKSLTSPSNAWRIYQASIYFDRNHETIRSQAADPQLAGLFELAREIRHRLHVRLERYLSARFQVRIHELANRVHRDWLHALFHLQRIVSETASEISLRPGHDPAMPEMIACELRELVEPGDVLVTRKEFALTNYFLPGYWPHAALYLGRLEELEQSGLAEHEVVRSRWHHMVALDAAEPGRVLEALKDGVRLRSLASPFSSDSLIVLRPKLTRSEILRGLARGLIHDGKPYDFDFDFTRSDRLVCTEVVYRAYDGVGGVAFALSRRAGRMTLAASDLVHMALEGRHFEVIAAFVPAQGPKVLRAEAPGLVRKMIN